MNVTSAEISSVTQWNDVSTCLLYVLLDMSAFCNMTLAEKSALDCEQALLTSINAAGSGKKASRQTAPNCY